MHYWLWWVKISSVDCTLNWDPNVDYTPYGFLAENIRQLHILFQAIFFNMFIIELFGRASHQKVLLKVCKNMENFLQYGAAAAAPL